MESLVFFISEKTAAKRTAYRNSHRTIFRKRHGYQNKIHLKKLCKNKEPIPRPRHTIH